MSTSLRWSRPPVEPSGSCNRAYGTKAIVARALFEHDGSVLEEHALMKDSPEYHYLRGAADTHPDSDVRQDLAELLAVVDEFGAARVWTEG